MNTEHEEAIRKTEYKWPMTEGCTPHIDAEV